VDRCWRAQFGPQGQRYDDDKPSRTDTKSSVAHVNLPSRAPRRPTPAPMPYIAVLGAPRQFQGFLPEWQSRCQRSTMTKHHAANDLHQQSGGDEE